MELIKLLFMERCICQKHIYFFLERGNFECFFFHIKKNKTADYDWTVSILKPANLPTNCCSFLYLPYFSILPPLDWWLKSLLLPPNPFFPVTCCLMDNVSFYNYLVTVHTKRWRWNRFYWCCYIDHCTRNVCWIRAVVYVAQHCVSRKKEKIASFYCLFFWPSVPTIVVLRMLWNTSVSRFFRVSIYGTYCLWNYLNPLWKP